MTVGEEDEVRVCWLTEERRTVGELIDLLPSGLPEWKGLTAHEESTKVSCCSRQIEKVSWMHEAEYLCNARGLRQRIAFCVTPPNPRARSDTCLRRCCGSTIPSTYDMHCGKCCFRVKCH